jgi:hypothetical protein
MVAQAKNGTASSLEGLASAVDRCAPGAPRCAIDPNERRAIYDALVVRIERGREPARWGSSGSPVRIRDHAARALALLRGVAAPSWNATVFERDRAALAIVNARRTERGDVPSVWLEAIEPQPQTGPDAGMVVSEVIDETTALALKPITTAWAAARKGKPLDHVGIADDIRALGVKHLHVRWTVRIARFAGQRGVVIFLRGDPHAPQSGQSGFNYAFECTGSAACQYNVSGSTSGSDYLVDSFGAIARAIKSGFASQPTRDEEYVIQIYGA